MRAERRINRMSSYDLKHDLDIMSSVWWATHTAAAVDTVFDEDYSKRCNEWLVLEDNHDELADDTRVAAIIRVKIMMSQRLVSGVGSWQNN